MDDLAVARRDLVRTLRRREMTLYITALNLCMAAWAKTIQNAVGVVIETIGPILTAAVKSLPKKKRQRRNNV